MAQPFLTRGEDRAILAGFHIDDPVGRKAGLGQSRREEVAAADAPEHLAPGSGDDTRSEESGCASMQGAVPAAGDFVQLAAGEAAARQATIHRVETKRQHALVRAPAGLDARDTSAQA